ncbi:neuraminidase-like domain-containing protein [Streptomyces sp. NPDC007808]|uniref:Tc toxin subunit A-related protein n=1 Tax=Streptomyces sp. NPDC007808 TaxID=3364779 RepID=UPI0036B72B5B
MRRDDLLRLDAAAALTPAELDAELIDIIGTVETDPPLPADVPLAANPVLGELMARARLERVAAASGVETAAADAVFAAAGAAAVDGLDDARLVAMVDDGQVSAEDARSLGFTIAVQRLMGGDLAQAEAVRSGLDATPEGGLGTVRRLVALDDGDWQLCLDEAGVAPPHGLDSAGFARVLRKRLQAAFPTDALAAHLAGREDASDLLVAQLIELNPDVELVGLDLSPESPAAQELDFGDLSEADRQAALSGLKAWLRTLALSDGLDDAATLRAAGYDSAFSVVAEGEERFRSRSGLPDKTAAAYFAKASHVVEQTANAVGTVLETTGTGFSSLAVSNLAPSAAELFRRIDGYEELFGEQDFCRCEPCSSLLGPAAYFVDLMFFVETELIARGFPEAIGTDPLDLRVRRPDLWKLELTCENTETERPLLEIVNGVLEDHIASGTGYAGALGDRTAVGRHVYRDRIATAADSFAQPLLIPLEQTEILLTHFSETRGAIAELMDSDPDRVAAAKLHLSQREHELITTPDTSHAFLERVYRMALPLVGGAFGPLDAQELLRAVSAAYRKTAADPTPPADRTTAVTRDDLGALLGTAFVGGLRVQAGRRSADSVQNDMEYVAGASSEALDRLHRFTRLWRALTWSIGELDLVLAALRDEGLTAGLDAAALRCITRLLAIQEQLHRPVEELVGLFGPLPAPLFERQFNPPGLLDFGGRLPRGDLRFVHPGLRDAPDAATAADWALPRLVAGLRVDAGGLLTLICKLAAPLGVDLSAGAAQDARAFVLSRENLALLARHARLAEWLRLPLPALFRVLELAPGVAGGHVSSVDDLAALLEFHAWLGDGAAGPSPTELLDDLAYAGGRPLPATSRRPRPEGVARQLIARIRGEAAAVFTGALFAEVPGVSEEDSRAVFAANPGSFVDLGEGRMRLADDFDPQTALVVPSKLTAHEPALRRVLIARHPLTLAPAALAAVLSMDGAKSTALLGLCGASLTAPALARALRGDGPATPVEQLAALVLPFAALFRADAYDAATVDFIRTHRGLFALDDAAPAATGIEAARRAEAYRRLAQEVPPARRADLREVLGGFTAPAGFDAGSEAALTRLLDAGPGEVAALLAHLPLPATATAAFGRLRSAARTAARIGVDGAALARIAAPGYDDLAAGGAAVLAAFHAKYPDPAQWSEQYAPFEGRILGRRRDALADYLVFTAPTRTVALHRLYHPVIGDYLYTTSDEERNSAVATAGYVSEGDICQVFPQQQPGTVPLHRLAGQEENGNIYHLYTTSDDERSRYIDMASYHDEGTAGWVYPAAVPGSTALHRLTGEYAAELLTVSDAERDRAVTSRGFSAVADACWVPPAPFTDRADLHRYFLLDVEVDGCFPTSPVVAATGSLQLYLNRVLMNLEQDETGNRHVQPGWPPREELRRIRTRRAWQLAGDVYLHTENHLTGVHDDKTPLFDEFADTLLQKDIDEQAVLDAYSRYLTGFNELAGLEIAGSYHDIGADKDVLHLLGVTPGDPPNYYYRAVDNAHHGVRPNTVTGTVWGPWQPIDVQIPVRTVAPVVHAGRLYVFWVEITTTSQNQIIEGTSVFSGYAHRTVLKFTSLRLDGGWTSPQRVSLYGTPPFGESDGVVDDPLAEGRDWAEMLRLGPFGVFANPGLLGQAGLAPLLTPRYDVVAHTKAREGYTLSGFEWDRVFPESWGERLFVAGAGYQMGAFVDPFTKRSAPVDTESVLLPGTLFRTVNAEARTANGVPLPLFPLLCLSEPQIEPVGVMLRTTFSLPVFDNAALAAVMADHNRLTQLFRLRPDRPEQPWVELFSRRQRAGTPLLLLGFDSSLSPVNGSLSDAVLHLGQGPALPPQRYLVQSTVRPGRFLIRSLGTSLAGEMASRLFTSGVAGLLDLEWQRTALAEPAPAFTPAVGSPPIDNAVVSGRIDFQGPYGAYYREIFFHNPFLIARRSHYEQARRWYHQALFDPTAAEVIPDDPARTPAQNAARRKDRVWRYQEFRNLDRTTLRGILTDRPALEALRRDPFNAHAIARMRLSAHQKAVFIAYVTLELDRVDDLLAQFQQGSLNEQECLNEAGLLCATIADVLGERPAELGECGGRPAVAPTYETFRDGLRRGAVFLTELEHWVWLRNGPTPDRPRPRFTLDPGLLPQNGNTGSDDAADPVLSAGWNTTGPAMTPSPGGNGRHGPVLGLTLVRRIVSGFCVPPNQRLLDLWTRLEDRRWKLRHCQDITGARRDLTLFAPELPLDLLERAQRDGLSPEDLLDSQYGEVPAHRFSYVIERAKEHAGVVQAYDSALRGAIDRKESGELEEMLAVQAFQLITLNASAVQWQYDAAVESLNALKRRRAAVQARHDHLQTLLSTGLSPQEWVQRSAQYAAVTTQAAEATLSTAAGVAHLLPQLGAPTALTYGGHQVGDALDSFASVTRAAGSLWASVGATAAMEAGFGRRDEDWRFELEQTQHELPEIDHQIRAAELQRDIAEREQIVLERTRVQNAEVREFYQDRFTRTELFESESRTLLPLLRTSFASAYRLARMAERAYAYECDDDPTPVTLRSPSAYWDPGRAGLLAGMQLSCDLEAMQRRFIETERRRIEITQSFSLADIDPAALLSLAHTGECTFTLPELFFKLAYPGLYHLRIRGVRLTIPSVTGPYTNVGATLRLLSSSLRTTPDPAAAPAPMPLSGTVVMAASSGRGDGGVFRFDFEDPLRLPFAGAGAVFSTWNLVVPKGFRPWDYWTTRDLIMEISYTAKSDDNLRSAVEDPESSAGITLANTLATQPLTRVFSLRHDFPSAFSRLLAGPAGTTASLELTGRHLPYFLADRALALQNARLAVRTHRNAAPNGLRLALNGTELTGFASDPTTGGLPAADALAALGGNLLTTHEIQVVDGGDLKPAAAGAALDSAQLADVFLYVQFTVPRAPVDRDLRRAAAVGDAVAAYTLWERLRETDFAEAEEWLRTAVDLGDVRAAYRFGILLWERQEIDAAEAALRQGALDPQGSYALGRLLWRERGHPQEAVAWLDRAAHAGDPAAQRDLGRVLRELGDQAGARYWLERAGPLDPEARSLLSEMDTGTEPESPES